MKSKIFFFSLLFFLSNLPAQNLIDGAESVAYHAPTKSYFVSSLSNNRVIKIDSNKTYSIFKQNIIAFGNCIKGDTLFLASGSTVNGIDVYSADIIFSVNIPAAIQFDGMTYDNENNLFVVESRLNKIYKIDLTTGNYQLFIDTGLETATQDLYFDQPNNRILTCAYGANSSITAIDPVTGDITKITDTYGRFDGITMDEYGFVYLGTHFGGGQIIVYSNDFTMGPYIVHQGISEPSGLDYNKENRTIAAPSFAGDSVAFIKLPDNYFYQDFSEDKISGHKPLTVNFSDKTLTNHTIISRKWDFNNDGVIDSEEQQPSYTFNDTGVYTVKLTIETNIDTYTFIKDSLIRVFDGETSLMMNDVESKVEVMPSPELNLTDDFTIEAYIYLNEYPNGLRGGTVVDKSSIRLFVTGTALGATGDRSIVAAVKMSDGTTFNVTAPDDILSESKWQHVAVSFSSSIPSVKFYVNGNEYEGVVVGSNSITGSLMDNALNSLYIGNASDNLSRLRGRIDEVRIWNAVRSKEEILLTLFSGLTGNEPGLVAYWNMNEGGGDEIIDRSINSNIGYIESAPFREGVDFGSITDVKELIGADIPSEFDLQQNYPNPFNPTTKIVYSINEYGKSVLKVYDLLGCEVATLVNRDQQPGSYEINWSGKDDDGKLLSSGIYFYSLRAGQNVVTKKMILLR